MRVSINMVSHPMPPDMGFETRNNRHLLGTKIEGQINPSINAASTTL